MKLGQFLASKLQSTQVKEWNLAPKSFDFEVRHNEKALKNSTLKAWIEEFFRHQNLQHEIDGNLSGVVITEQGDYAVCITASDYLKSIRGTLTYLH